MAKSRPAFYVYALTYDDEIIYVGKGSGRRFIAQQKAFGISGHIVAEFWKEKSAYAFERVAIAEMAPRLNRHPGGNGPGSELKPEPRKTEIDRIGTRAYAAKILLWWHDRWKLFLAPETELMYWKVFNGQPI